MFRRIVPVFVALLTATPAFVIGQGQSTATLSGVFKDSSGGVIPGATIRIVNAATNASAEVVADGQGADQSEPLTAGRYRVEVTLDGSETATREIVIDLGRVAAADFTLEPARLTEAVVVTARRVEETVQEVPIPVSVVSGNLMADAGAFNVNRLKEMIPTVQFYSTNPRNSSIDVRGLGAPFGLTNDGIEPGVGLDIDGVFFSRPASATLDFLDVERVEVLRGPQGTLFGKNTSAGAINVTTKKPTFSPETDVELNYGNVGFVQGKSSISGPLSEKLAGRGRITSTTGRRYWNWDPSNDRDFIGLSVTPESADAVAPAAVDARGFATRAISRVTITNCSRQRRATPVSTSDSPATAGRSA